MLRAGGRASCGLLGLLLAGLVACQAGATPEPTLTPSPLPATATQTPPATIVWFPPTATHTPFPTPVVTPTEALPTEVGAPIFKDDFSQPGLWESAPNPGGSVSIVNEELTIAITEPGGFVYAARRGPVLTDFQVEVTAHTSLCAGLDEYGLMLRLTPESDYYRFSLSCDGQVRLDRIYRGGAASLETWAPGSGVPPGAPGQVRFGVRVAGQEMRFFVADQHQFTIEDPQISAGVIGLFARSANENAVTVSFSQLDVYELEN